jgi:hypothetical protein
MNQPGDVLPPTFQALESRLSDLQARLQRGELDESTYQLEVQGLTFEDESGNSWWLAGAPGAWHLWDGRAWKRVDPPKTAGRSSESPEQRSGRGSFLRGFGLGTVVVLGLVAIFMIIGWQAYQQEPMIVEGVEPQALDVAQYTLSPDQSRVIDQRGNPEAFVILFYEEEQADGSLLDVRFETWSYYTAQVEYTFLNGQQAAEDRLEIEMQGELLPIPYRPEQFIAYMSLEQVIASANLSTYLVVPLEKELVEDGDVYYADELTFGLKDDELLYIEVLALEGVK